MILAFVPIVVLAGMMIFLLSPYGQSLINVGTPLPQVTIEKVEFHDNQILAFIRNTGPLDIVVSQADVNDRIQSAAIEPSSKIPRLGEAHVMIPFPWIPGTPYEIGITTSDGTRFSKSVEAAAMAPNPDANQALLFTSLGVYVGVIPIMIGLLWYPYIRRISIGKYSFFLSLTAGLLVFLGIDALLEVNEIVIGNLASVFNGQALGILVTISTFVVLLYTSDRLTQRAIEKSVVSKTRSLASSNSVGESSSQEKSVIENQKGEIYSEPTKVSSSTREIQIQLRKYQELLKPLTISMMIAIGIGLHNFGEGLAIGARHASWRSSTQYISNCWVHSSQHDRRIGYSSPNCKIRSEKKHDDSEIDSDGINCGSSHNSRNMDWRFSLFPSCSSCIFISWGRGNIPSSIFINFMDFPSSKAQIFTLHLWTSGRRIYYRTTNNVFYGLTYMTDAQL